MKTPRPPTKAISQRGTRRFVSAIIIIKMNECYISLKEFSKDILKPLIKEVA